MKMSNSSSDQISPTSLLSFDPAKFDECPVCETQSDEDLHVELSYSHGRRGTGGDFQRNYKTGRTEGQFSCGECSFLFEWTEYRPDCDESKPYRDRTPNPLLDDYDSED